MHAAAEGAPGRAVRLCPPPLTAPAPPFCRSPPPKARSASWLAAAPPRDAASAEVYVEERLGAGGRGTVFRGYWHTKTAAAIKVGAPGEWVSKRLLLRLTRPLRF